MRHFLTGSGETVLILLILVFQVIGQNVPSPSPSPPPVAVMSGWTAPVSREKSITLFAPKPFRGDNIFKGDGEKWLADAIIKVEVGRLTPITDVEITEYISRIGRNLVKYSTAPNKSYEFIVLDDDDENAMNIGDGRIYINLGMLKAVMSEDELAGVLAHEIGHDAFGHAPKTVTRQLFWMKGTRKASTPAEVEKALHDLLDAYAKNQFAAAGEALLGWSRANEIEADKAAFYNTFKAGYNPYALIETFRRYVKYEKKNAGDDYRAYQFLTVLFGSHPPSSQRVTAVKWESNWVKMPPKDSRYPSAAFDAMKKRVAGM